MTEELFFDLIRVAIGSQVCLSHSPSADEWGKLYDMAKKQSLVGVCFAGVQKLVTQKQEPPEMLYLTWMGMAAKIQQRNEVVNRQCAELQTKLSTDGLRSCVLKGQGIAALYGQLAALRQSGDIDVWVKATPERVIEYADRYGFSEEPTYLHVGANVFTDTPVELHWRPTLFRNLFHNSIVQRWCNVCSEDTFKHLEEYGFDIPSDDFNRVFNLSHLYRHFMFEGVGLRQVLDYYYVLMNTTCSDSLAEQNLICRLGMKKFASALMWVLKVLFALPGDKFLFSPDEKEGRFLLEEIMQMGNFGRGDTRNSEDRVQVRMLKKWAHLLLHYPSEVIWNPVWIICRKLKKY